MVCCGWRVLCARGAQEGRGSRGMGGGRGEGWADAFACALASFGLAPAHDAATAAAAACLLVVAVL